MQHPRVKSFLNTRSHGEFFSKFKIVYIRLCKSAAISEKWDVFMYEILWWTSTRTEKSLLSIKTSVSCKQKQSMPNFNEIKTENRDPDGENPRDHARKWLPVPLSLIPESDLWHCEGTNLEKMRNKGEGRSIRRKRS